jgi:plasmid maintenance system antidote protein VapI
MTATFLSEGAMNHLIDHLVREYDLRNDAALAKTIGVHPPTISKLRHGGMSLTPAVILKIHEAFDMPVKEIKRIAYGK